MFACALGWGVTNWLIVVAWVVQDALRDELHLFMGELNSQLEEDPGLRPDMIVVDEQLVDVSCVQDVIMRERNVLKMVFFSFLFGNASSSDREC